MATLLIIGGTGFFGKSIIDAYHRNLLKHWKIDKIIALSRNASNLAHNAPELMSSNIELMNADISKIDFLPNADYVIHAAASTDASKYLSQGDKEKTNIIKGTLNYCDLAPRFNKHSKIVFCSSGAVYGYQPKNITHLSENMAFGHIDQLDDTKKSYAYAKRDAEQAIQRLGQSGLNVSIARCFAFAGKYLPRDQHFAFGNFIADGLAGRDIVVKTNKAVYRSYLYADDLVTWLLSIAAASSKTCPIYNVGSDEEVEIRQLAQIIAEHFNVGTNVIHPISLDNVDRYIPSIDKIKSELNLLLTNNLSILTKLSI
jgi:nucleoside-diphosphate-sugar epimerase